MNNSSYIHATNCITPLGFSVDETFTAMLAGKSGIQLQEDEDLLPQAFYAGRISIPKIEEEANKIAIPTEFTMLEKILILALNPIVQQFPVTENSLLILSTTKGNIDLLKQVNTEIQVVQLPTLAQKIADYFGFKKKPVVISNACVSGVVALQIAKSMLEMNYCEDVFCVAGDQVTEFVLSGFNSFQAMSSAPCQPYDAARTGVNLGEATAAVYLNKMSAKFELLSATSINDANHISGPSRTGEGLFRTISSALKMANLEADSIDFISAHGTATIYNDEMESIAFHRADLIETPVNSLKGYFGHTLGTSGLLETVLSLKSMEMNTLVPSIGFKNLGVSQPINVIQRVEQKALNYLLKTASGFGGTNAAVIIKKTAHESV